MKKSVKVVAIFPELLWVKLEKLLVQFPIKGLTVMSVSGFGSYRNYFREDMLSRGLKIEIYTTTEYAKILVPKLESFINTHTDASEHGLVAVEPVNHINLELNDEV